MEKNDLSAFRIQVTDPKCPPLGKGMNAYTNHLFTEAIDFFNQAISDLAGTADSFRLSSAWKWKGRTYHELKRYEEELNCYERSIEVDPNDFELWFNKANVLDDLGRFDEAVPCYDNAVALNPQSFSGWYDRGLVLRKLARHEDALLSFERALEVDPKKTSAWLAKGAELGALSRFAEEVTCYDHALSINPFDPKIWFNRGEALGSMGRKAEAISCFDRAIELNPRFTEAWFDKGVTLLNSGQIADALACFEEARLLGSDKAVQIIQSLGMQELIDLYLNDQNITKDQIIHSQGIQEQTYHSSGPKIHLVTQKKSSGLRSLFVGLMFLGIVVFGVWISTLWVWAWIAGAPLIIVGLVAIFLLILSRIGLFTTVQCPNCGNYANLKWKKTLKCYYCGSESKLQIKT